MQPEFIDLIFSLSSKSHTSEYREFVCNPRYLGLNEIEKHYELVKA